MKRNQNMSDEDWRWFQLWRESGKYSSTDAESLEEQLRIEGSNIDVRIQLIGYYYLKCPTSNINSETAEQKLFKHVLWFIENKPLLQGFLRYQITKTGFSFKPKRFATLREAWLEKVSAASLNGTILGNAGWFIAWNDVETASSLLERAYQLQPNEGWLGTFVIHLHSELGRYPSIYAHKIREQIIDVGVRSLKSEPSGAQFLTSEYVSDAALYLGQYDLVRWCAEILLSWKASCAQMANAYLGLVALREGDRDSAVQLLSEKKPGYYPQEVVFRLAKELFELGERESIIQLIKNLNGKIKASARDRWLEQITNNKPPDFSDC